MGTLEVTALNFEATVQSGFVLLDWWAPWCMPCRSFAPIFEAAANRHADLVFGKINTETEPTLAASFQIRSIPTLMIFREGVLLASQAGALPGPALETLIKKVRNVDMNQVLRSLGRSDGRGTHVEERL